MRNGQSKLNKAKICLGDPTPLTHGIALKSYRRFTQAVQNRIEINAKPSD